MELNERFRVVIDPVVSHNGPGSGEAGPRFFNLFIRDRVSNATLNAYLVGSEQSVQTVVGQDEFLQFARLVGGPEDVFGILVDQILKDRGIASVTPYISFVRDLRPLKPPRP